MQEIINAMAAIVTTGRKISPDSVTLAQAAATRLQIPYVERRTAGLPALKAKYGVDFVLVAKQGLLTLETPGGELFFHPNMAHLRLKNLRGGDPDRMVDAMGLAPGMSVLDCTLGFGADAIVASYAVGPKGQVTGIESQPLIEAVVGHGLAYFTGDSPYILEPMRRIRTLCEDALHYLQQQADDSIDVIYFDPMFRHPFMDSTSLDPLRTVADKRALTAETVAEACRVARCRVVMKESSRSEEFSRLGFQIAEGGRYSNVRYGVIHLQTGCGL